MEKTLLNDIMKEDGDFRQHTANEEKCLLKDQLRNVMREKHLNPKPYINENRRLLQETMSLVERFRSTSSLVHDELQIELRSRSSEVTELSSTLEEMKCQKNILERIMTLNSAIAILKDKFLKYSFFECATCLDRINELITQSNDLKDLHLFIQLKQEFILLREQMLFAMTDVWTSLVLLEVKASDGFEESTLKVIKKDIEKIKDVVQAAFHLGDSLVIKRFINKVKDKILLPLVVNIGEITMTASDSIVELNVKVQKSGKKPHSPTVLQNILKVIAFIKSHLDVCITNDKSFLSEMGSLISEELIDSIMKNCMSIEFDEMESSDELITLAESFQSSLQSLGFLPVESSHCVNQVYNVNVIFANKMYISYLSKAREVMRKDIHSVTTSQDIIVSDWEVLPSKIKTSIEDYFSLKSGNCSLFVKCQVSKSAEEILNLVQMIETEVEKSDESRALRLLLTIRNIFEMYGAVVPVEHSKLLDTIPQQTAIFHNNCLYFSHYLIKLAFVCYETWPNPLKELYCVFLDEALSLRHLAVQSLESCVQNRRSQLIYILRDSGLGTLFETSTLDAATEKSVRQCLRQLQLLCNVWTTVLSNNVFTNAMAYLADALMDEMINLVLATEDISSQTATELVNIFTVVQNRLPSLFSEPKEIHRICKKWGKFKEFTLLLGGHLSNIADRWSDGAGPLACEFSADQVKHLIRALFQNTERRAALLARIK